MKIVLVQPAVKIWTRAAIIPLGLAYIAAYLEKNGFFEIKVIDCNVEREVTLPKADIVGITATTPLINGAWKIAREAKKKGAITVLGGPHATVLPEESIRLPQVDFVAVGEGEETMLELCQALESGRDNLEKISGLVYKKEKRIIFNKPRPFIKNLNNLPRPAYHFFSLSAYTSTQPLISIRKPSVGILTSRGCPYNCNFCYKGVFGKVWRPRSVENVLAEWEYLVNDLKIKEIALMDDGFNIDIDRATKICQEIKRKGLAVPWRAHNGIRADRAPIELLKAMKDSGCYLIAFGVESGCQRVLDTIGKNLKLEDVKRTYRNCRKLGILTMAFFMIGNPGETKEEIEKTIEFALELDPDFAQFTVATPFPGTALFKQVNNIGKIKISDWSQYNQFTQNGYFDFGNLKAGDVSTLAKLAYRRFYLRPKMIYKLIKRKETWLNLPNILRGASHFLLQKDI